MDPEREDGPIELGRYDGRGGPPTFGGAPLALTQEDLDQTADAIAYATQKIAG